MNVKFDGGGNFYSFKFPKKLCGRTGGFARTYTVLSTCFCTSNTIVFCFECPSDHPDVWNDPNGWVFHRP